MTNSIKFSPTSKPVKADPDSVVKLQNLPAENAGIRFEAGSSGHVKFGSAKATAFSFDVDVRQSIGRPFRLTKNTKEFSVSGGPVIYVVGTAEYLS